MNRQSIVSSNLKSAGYDPQTQILEVEFTNGSIYQYSKVPQDVYTGLLTAPSAGKFFFSAIKNQYQYSRADKPMHTTGD